MTAQAFASGFRAPKVNIHDFTMIPRAEIPRSKFKMQHQVKKTMSAAALVPVYVQEVLPGDSFNVSMTAFVRLTTPLFPIMDNFDLESFFFFVPNRLVWIHWKQFMGEQNSPADSIVFNIPQVVSPVGGFTVDTIFDHFGLPTTGQTAAGNTISVSALPFRAYNLIYNEWFRDQNLTNGLGFGSTNGTGYGGSAVMDDGPDPATNYTIQGIKKRHDYFTSCLPWTQKGAAGPVLIPLTGNAIVKAFGTNTLTGAQNPIFWLNTDGTNPTTGHALQYQVSGSGTAQVATTTVTTNSGLAQYPSNLYADLSTVTGPTATTINALRLAFQTQKLLERDARGGTRYTEIIRSHFGVVSPDARLQRPEYLGGGKTPVVISAVPQTTQTGLTGGTTPLGTLGGIGTAVANHGFNASFTEHGHIIGIVGARSDQIYQQGIRKMWKRLTRYDYYFPVFAMLGEQAVLNYEIFSDGSANDALTFGYQERWAEYRYHPSRCDSFFRSTHATPLDAWHLATKFASLPTLNASFINEPLDVTLQRCTALGASGEQQQLLCDFLFTEIVARPMPMYSVPGLIDHF